jgi:adenylyltransferase/sulfurtransferase
MFQFSEDQIKRYSRQIILPEVGGKGQRKLLSASVLIVGMGGLGSPAALYLAAAGVGTLGIVDFDEVELSNLHRQVIHTTNDLGKPKVLSAQQTMKAINPDVDVRVHRCRVRADNVMELIAQYDLILDGSDNFSTRFLLNDACLMAGKTNISGAVSRFDGQVTVFSPGEGPCYRCLLPEMPPPGSVPSCQEAGVLGVLPGIIGLIQATEAIKLILGIGSPLIGRMLIFDGLEMKFHELKIRRNPLCPACGEGAELKELRDYEDVCEMGGQ